MVAPSAVYVCLEEGICSGRGIKSLCEKLADRGYATPGTQFEVYSFYDEVWVTSIRCVSEGEWIKFVPEHWESAYKPRKRSSPPKIGGILE